MRSNIHCTGSNKIALVGLDTAPDIALPEGAASNRGHDLVCKDVPLAATGPKNCELAPSAFDMTADERQRFLRIIWNFSQIRHHYELFLLLQGELQHCIPHQIFLAAWGDFRDWKPTLDVVSALPGVRTAEVIGCGAEVEGMLTDLHARWVVNGRRKMLLTNGRVKSITSSLCDCALHKSMRKMQSILVHGIHNERDQTDSIYVALDSDSALNSRSVERFFALVDPLIEQIEIAFQRVDALKSVGATAGVDSSSGPGNLSEREREIMKWFVAEDRRIVEAVTHGPSSG